jgi:hypothetical protein
MPTNGHFTIGTKGCDCCTKISRTKFCLPGTTSIDDLKKKLRLEILDARRDGDYKVWILKTEGAFCIDCGEPIQELDSELKYVLQKFAEACFLEDLPDEECYANNSNCIWRQ